MKRLLIVLLASVSVAACVSTPSTTPSQVEIKPDALGLSAVPAPSISDTWWDAFGDKQLDDLVAQALAGNPSLQSALARMRLAQSELSATRADTYPQLTADAQEQPQRFSKNYIIPPPYGGTDRMGRHGAGQSFLVARFLRQAGLDGRAGALIGGSSRS